MSEPLIIEQINAIKKAVHYSLGTDFQVTISADDYSFLYSGMSELDAMELRIYRANALAASKEEELRTEYPIFNKDEIARLLQAMTFYNSNTPGVSESADQPWLLLQQKLVDLKG